MYQVPGFGSVDISAITNISADGEYVVISMSDGEHLYAEADFNEVLSAVRCAHRIENGDWEDHEELIEDLYDIWSKHL